MNLLTQEQIAELDLDQTKKALKRLAKAFDIDKSLLKDPTHLPNLDSIVNNLLWLEDHQFYLERYQEEQE